MAEIEKRLRHAPRVGPGDVSAVRTISGIYAAWYGRKCLYVGRSGNLQSRLKSHFSGRRGGDQFCLYVYDKYIHGIRPRNLTTPEVDELTAKWIREGVRFRWAVVSDARARRVERHFRVRLQPSLNALPE
ncbi:MAG: GIY-YIG nuclease family protein [bacterium]